MKISYKWLRERLPSLEIPAPELAPRLLALGFEVAGIERRGPAFSGVVTAEVLAIAKHPNADRLSLCEVADGTAKYSVVCGAKNVAAGQKIALAKIGAKLPGGTITRAKIRGVESQGMICSSAELGLPATGEDGIRVLPPETKLGQDFAALFGEQDDVLEVEITPNRPDCLSHLGLARELAAALRLPLKAALDTRRSGVPADFESLPVSVEDAAACPRYLGRLIKNVRVGPSPAWLAQKLAAVGLRPINNVVDVTNFILMDMGQPLHAFDARLLAGARVLVRAARAGEKIKALDGRDYALDPRCLVIADAERAQAIAGVMGGAESAVTEKTTDVFLESAHFAPARVRASSQFLRLRSDSSYRFERGTDVEAVAAASAKAAELILELGGDGAQSSPPLDVYPKKEARAPITITSDRVNKILGASFSSVEVETALAEIGAAAAGPGNSVSFTPPSYRRDLATVWDLSEEVARLLGYDRIPARAAPHAGGAKDLPAQKVAERCRRRLAAGGLFEAYNYDFLSEKLLAQAGIVEGAGLAFARLANPLNEDWTILRPTLLAGLLQNAALNLNRGAASVRLFEIGKIYRKDGTEVRETAALSGLVLGPRAAAHWQNPGEPSGFYDVKGLVSDLVAGLPDLAWKKAEPRTDRLFQPQASLALASARGVLATIGLLHPQAARTWDLERAGAAIFELDLDLLASLPPVKMIFKPYSIFPSSRRDLSFFVDRALAYAEIEQAVAACRIDELRSLDLVDVFTGKGVPEGKKSLTVRLSFAREDRTLKDAEVGAAVENILAALSARFSAVLRS